MAALPASLVYEGSTDTSRTGRRVSSELSFNIHGHEQKLLEHNVSAASTPGSNIMWTLVLLLRSWVSYLKAISTGPL